MAGVLMIEDKLKYVYRDEDRHGRARWYFKRGRGHKKLRIKAEPGTIAFRAAYNAALAGSGERPTVPASAAVDPKGTLRWLCEKYLAAPVIKAALSERTLYARRLILESCCAEPWEEKDPTQIFGDCPIDLLRPKDVAALRDRKAGLPEASNGRVKALRQVFKWAIKPEVDLATFNPTAGVDYMQGSGDGFHTWTIAEVEQYQEHHRPGTKARLALALLLFTGVRRSDLVRLGRTMIRDGWLSFTEVKGRRRKVKQRDLPVLPELQAEIDAMPKTELTYLTFLVTEFGKAFTSNGFGNWFRKRCDEAGLPPECAAHGLRKAGATIAADNGATEFQLMSIFGWETTKQAGVYTKKANRKRLAGAAMHMMVPAKTGTNVTHPEIPNEAGGKQTRK